MQNYNTYSHTQIQFPVKTLSQFIEYYPKLFSQKNFTAWRTLFDDHATMTKVQASKLSSTTYIDEAMPEQIEYGNENDTFIEEWNHVESHEYGNIAIVKANYTLTVDAEIREGVDIVTLLKNKDGWKIINLVYEETKLIKRI